MHDVDDAIIKLALSAMQLYDYYIASVGAWLFKDQITLMQSLRASTEPMTSDQRVIFNALRASARRFRKCMRHFNAFKNDIAAYDLSMLRSLRSMLMHIKLSALNSCALCSNVKHQLPVGSIAHIKCIMPGMICRPIRDMPGVCSGDMLMLVDVNADIKHHNAVSFTYLHNGCVGVIKQVENHMLMVVLDKYDHAQSQQIIQENV